MIKSVPVLLCLMLVFGLHTASFSQSPVNDTTLSVSPNRLYTLHAAYAEAVALKCTSCSFDKSFFLVGNDTLPVTADPHEEQTALVFLGSPTEKVSYFSGEIAGSIQIYFIKTGTVSPSDRPNLRTDANDCEVEPVAPSIWRQGLPSPSDTPSRTETKHIVIHHSATANNVADPYQAVRSIYTYHTQVNKWSDIGYNYLIAPDGTIFQGRDSQGLFDPDYVVGAHMCGVNSGTMGICMLGTFTNTLPTDEALQSLYKLVKWKADKDKIAIFGSTSHAIGPPSAGLGNKLLANVCGHREGCRSGYTECPGDALYQQLAVVKEKADKYTCAPSQNPLAAVVHPNPADDQINTNFSWHYVKVYDIRGVLIGSGPYQKNQPLSVKGLTKGVYLFYFYTTDYGNIVRKIVVV